MNTTQIKVEAKMVDGSWVTCGTAMHETAAWVLRTHARFGQTVTAESFYSEGMGPDSRQGSTQVRVTRGADVWVLQ